MISKFRLFDRESEDVVGEIVLNSCNDPDEMYSIFIQKADEYNWGEDQSVENCFEILYSTAIDYKYLIEGLTIYFWNNPPEEYKNKFKTVENVDEQGIYINFDQSNYTEGRTYDIINTEPDAAN